MKHLFTDYVFGGKADSPYVEGDELSPINVYGASKLAGEVAVLSAVRTHLMLRTASVFSEFSHNFVKPVLNLGTAQNGLNVVADQLSCPTDAADIAANDSVFKARHEEWRISGFGELPLLRTTSDDLVSLRAPDLRSCGQTESSCP
jgi:dTDP-4-dehydrorhamnose reductase